MRETQSNTVFHNIIKMRELGILFVLIAMIFIFSVTSSVFFTVNNFLNITRQISLLGIMAMGMTMVIAVGGVDLSVGAVYAICSTSAAALMTRGQIPILPACLIALLQDHALYHHHGNDERGQGSCADHRQRQDHLSR